jgi:hypothetical protein
MNSKMGMAAVYVRRHPARRRGRHRNGIHVRSLIRHEFYWYDLLQMRPEWQAEVYLSVGRGLIFV